MIPMNLSKESKPILVPLFWQGSPHPSTPSARALTPTSIIVSPPTSQCHVHCMSSLQHGAVPSCLARLPRLLCVLGRRPAIGSKRRFTADVMFTNLETTQINSTMNTPLSFSSDAHQKNFFKKVVAVVKKVAPIASVIFPGSSVIGKVAGVAALL